MKLKALSVRSLLLALTVNIPSAFAVCLDPENGISGYKMPLATEVRTAGVIVIGRVMSEHLLQEDADDPDGVTASNLRIKVLEKLKGNSPSVLVIRKENTSSRYPMSVGEKHLLFISRANRGRWINNCGNSKIMPDGERVVKEVRTQLQASK